MEKGNDDQRAGFVSFLDKFCVCRHALLAISSKRLLIKTGDGGPCACYCAVLHTPPYCLESQLAEVPSCYMRVPRGP